jgi:glutamate N-acetyltransferase/amino-acid N-acetyltransferase
MVIVSKNANVANGSDGDRDALDVVAGVADQIGCDASDVLLASTGVIGRRYPIERVRSGIAAIPVPFTGRAAQAAASGIMTTDTVP